MVPRGGFSESRLDHPDAACVFGVLNAPAIDRHRRRCDRARGDQAREGIRPEL
jgi:hypothetical protein